MLSCMLIILISSCGNDSHNPSSGTGAIDFNAQMHVVQILDHSMNTRRAASGDCENYDIVSVTANVYDEFGLKIASGGPWHCSAESGTIEGVPAGNVTVVILCEDSDGKIKLGGEKTGITVVPGGINNAGVIHTYPFVPSFSLPPFISNGELFIQINEVPGAAEYHIIVSENSDLSDPISELHTSDIAFSLPGFSEDIIYYGQITALDSDGTLGSESKRFSTDQFIMIGDNDGYGYGSSEVPDNSNLPLSSHTNGDWIFYNQERSESSATDGSQYTDEEAYDQMAFSFTITFPPVDPDNFYVARFILDVTGIQTEAFGSSSLKLDGIDFSSYLPQEQGIHGSDVVVISIYNSNLFEDGSLTIDFQGAPFPDPDAIAFDFFGLEILF